MIEFDNRPWGRWEEYLNEPGYRVKRILLYPGKRLSLQRHQFREEHWVVVSGTGLLTLGEEQRPVSRGDVAHIRKGEIHRIQNTGEDYLVFIETQMGICLEDDVERIEDDWKRQSPELNL